MVTYTVYARAFHPDKKFGSGGLFFSGDDRGFTYDTSGNTTSRIWAFWKFDTSNFNIIDGKTDSDPSEGVFGEGSPILGDEKYEEKSKKPTEEANFSTSPLFISTSPILQHIKQLATLQWSFKGINHAFTKWESFNNLVVPELNLEGNIFFEINRQEGKERLFISSTLRGDGFPNSEVFIIDSVGMPLMLNTHHRMGYAAGQLGGDAKHLLGGTELRIAINSDGNFTGPIRATRCVDFMPEARDLLIEEDGWFRDTYKTNYSLTKWNKLHIDRDPSEKYFLGGDTDDALPIPAIPLINPPKSSSGQKWNDWDDPFTSPGPEDLPDWNH